MDREVVQTAGTEEDDRQISCSMSAVIVKLIRTQGGDAAIAELLRGASSRREQSYLEDTDNWISLDEACALLESGVAITGEENFARRVGEETLHQHAGKQVATLLRSLGSVDAVLQAVARTAGKLSTVTDMEAIEASPGRIVVTATAREGYTRRRLHCDWTTGLLAGSPILFGLPVARVHESECQARGDAQCRYTVTWDAEQAAAAADPQQRVTALEAQLIAVSERLHSIYAIASDLVSTEDVETVLRRIVERASDAVRAPSHILAVRPDPSAELQVYSRGISAQEAEAVARAGLAGDPSIGGSALAVEVTSSRRTYGQLIARYPGPTEFFPQDEELLTLYAKHAAAVLDMALALQESAKREEQVSALLALSHALAAAGTSVEVAERLAAAAPEVVDCDRMAVWLWNDRDGELRPTAAWARVSEHAEELLEVCIRPEDTPHLREMLSEPRTQFFESGTNDAFVDGLLEALEVVALTVVPIVARGAFLGVLTVSVSENPERLRPDNDLMERLTGVAALAAPAIQNGQLVDQLNHKASHDGLTGLLNRIGFKQRIDAALDRAGGGEGQVGLLFVDLNRFKQVNDVYGHEAGDELIRQAAVRLGAVCRGEDLVARLGGDEFAIILSDVSRNEQVRAAERRVKEAFLEPFLLDEITVSVGASVGGGVWPGDGDTVVDLVRHADAAMYVDKARSRQPTALAEPQASR